MEDAFDFTNIIFIAVSQKSNGASDLSSIKSMQEISKYILPNSILIQKSTVQLELLIWSKI